MTATNLFAFGYRVDYFQKPQAGVWFGPVTPIASTADMLDVTLGGGGFFRYNLPIRPVKLGFDFSYQYFESDGVNEMAFVPVYGSIIYLLPIDFPVKFQLKAGAGSSWVKIMPDDIAQWTPLLTAGFELSFPAGRRVNIGLRLDYHCIYEKHLEGAKKNGHIFTTGITLFFNI